MKWEQTYNGRKSDMYTKMKKRIGTKPTYQGLELMSAEEFKTWIGDHDEEYSTLYSAWVESGFDRQLCPTIDRLDPYRGYAADNIQLATFRENCTSGAKRVMRRKTGKTGYKGVRPNSTGGYDAVLHKDGQPMYVGHFKDPAEAAQAYDEAAVELHGDKAELNFPPDASQEAVCGNCKQPFRGGTLCPHTDASQGCIENPISSAVCERGTKCCTVRHSPQGDNQTKV